MRSVGPIGQVQRQLGRSAPTASFCDFVCEPVAQILNMTKIAPESLARNGTAGSIAPLAGLPIPTNEIRVPHVQNGESISVTNGFTDARVKFRRGAPDFQVFL